MTSTIDETNKYIYYKSLSPKIYFSISKSKRKSQHELFVVSCINQSLGMFMFQSGNEAK